MKAALGVLYVFFAAFVVFAMSVICPVDWGKAMLKMHDYHGLQALKLCNGFCARGASHNCQFQHNSEFRFYLFETRKGRWDEYTFGDAFAFPRKTGTAHRCLLHRIRTPVPIATVRFAL